VCVETLPFDTTQITSPLNYLAYRTSGNCGAYATGDHVDALTTGTDQTSHILLTEPLTLAIRGRGDASNLEYRSDGTANALLTPNGGRAGIGCGAAC
jgi:hypothetical protein